MRSEKFESRVEGIGKGQRLPVAAPESSAPPLTDERASLPPPPPLRSAPGSVESASDSLMRRHSNTFALVLLVTLLAAFSAVIWWASLPASRRGSWPSLKRQAKATFAGVADRAQRRAPPTGRGAGFVAMIRGPLDRALTVSTQAAARVAQDARESADAGRKGREARQEVTPQKQPVARPSEGEAFTVVLTAEEAAEEAWRQVSVSALLSAGARSMARIDGEVLAIGETGSSGFRLEEVEPLSVTLSRGGERRRVQAGSRSGAGGVRRAPPTGP